MKNINYLEPLADDSEVYANRNGALPGKFFKTKDGRVFQVCSYVVSRINMEERTIVSEVIFIDNDKTEV